MIKSWTDAAWEDFEYWMKQDKKTLKRILQLLKDIDRNGYEGIGKPERLSGDLASYWSRRIDEANRIVYRIENDVVKIILIILFDIFRPASEYGRCFLHPHILPHQKSPYLMQTKTVHFHRR